jgi:hypothetical protein
MAKLRLTFSEIDDDAYIWATEDSLAQRGPYELCSEPWSRLPDGTETYNVYKRIGAKCWRSDQAVTLREFRTLPLPTIPAPSIVAVEMDDRHRFTRR